MLVSMAGETTISNACLKSVEYAEHAIRICLRNLKQKPSSHIVAATAAAVAVEQYVRDSGGSLCSCWFKSRRTCCNGIVLGVFGMMLFCSMVKAAATIASSLLVD